MKFVKILFVLRLLAESLVQADTLRRRTEEDGVPKKPVIDVDTSALNKNVDETGEVFNGSAAASGEFPAFALLVYTSQTGGCGGFLISSRHVLTAGHCFVRSDGSTFTPIGVRI